MSRRSVVSTRAAALAAACSFVLSACVAEGGSSSPTFGPKHLQPVSMQTMALFEQKGMNKDSPILLRIFKEESELEIWKQNRDGKFALLKTYPICRWSGELGPKIKEGDRQAPEGFYFITPELMNPRSSYYLAFNLGYPNEFDRSLNRSGAHLMVHGDCSSRGCYAMTDEQIQDIFALARDSFDGGQLAFQVQAFPFRMTAKNMARHRKNPHMAFWRMLKEGSDHFEISKQQPKVDVCERRYVFNAHLLDPSQPFDATGRCPEYEIPESIAVAARAKKTADDREMSVLANLLPAAPIVTGRDGGTNQAFAGPPGMNMSTGQIASGTNDGQFVAASRPASSEMITGSTGNTRDVPMPPNDPRRQDASSSTRTAFSTGNGSRGRVEQNGGQPAARSEPVPAPAQEREISPALPGATPIRASGGFSFR